MIAELYEALSHAKIPPEMAKQASEAVEKLILQNNDQIHSEVYTTKIVPIEKENIGIRAEIRVLSETMKVGFATIERLFEARAQAVDKQFQAVEMQFQTVDKHFQAVEKQFQAVDKHFQAVDKQFQAIDKQFQTVDKHFQAVEMQFQTVDKHFQAVDKQFQAVDRQFQAINKRFDLLTKLFWLIVGLMLTGFSTMITLLLKFIIK